MKHLSSKDLREIRRVVRSVKVRMVGCELGIGSCGEKKQESERRRKGRHWSEWMGRKGPDIVICFEEGA